MVGDPPGIGPAKILAHIGGTRRGHGFNQHVYTGGMGHAGKEWLFRNSFGSLVFQQLKKVFNWALYVFSKHATAEQKTVMLYPDKGPRQRAKGKGRGKGKGPGKGDKGNKGRGKGRGKKAAGKYRGTARQARPCLASSLPFATVA